MQCKLREIIFLDGHEVSECFVLVYFLIPSHIFLIVSTFFAFLCVPSIRSFDVVRAVCCLFLSVFPLVLTFVMYVQDDDINVTVLIYQMIQFLCWLFVLSYLIFRPISYCLLPALVLVYLSIAIEAQRSVYVMVYTASFSVRGFSVCLQIFILSVFILRLIFYDPIVRRHALQVQTDDFGHLNHVPPNLGEAENATVLSRLYFSWVYPLMRKGSLGQIENNTDLMALPTHLKTLLICNKFEQNLKPSLLATLNAAFGKHYYSLGILKLLGDLLGYVGPVLLNYLLNFMENKKEPMFHGYIYALGLFLCTLLGAFLSTHFNYQVTIVSLKLRAALIDAIYKKTLFTKKVRLSNFNTGQIVNFMSIDTERIMNFCPSFHAFWSLPLQVAVSLYLLYMQIELSVLAGLAFMVVLIPVNRCIALRIQMLSEQMMGQKDSRIKTMSEILHGIQVVKFFAWEIHFEKKISHLRREELLSLKGRKYLDALCVFFWATTPTIIAILSFSCYVLLGNQLTAAKVFTSLALFNMLIMPLNAFPWVINGLMEARVSLLRIQELLLLPEKIDDDCESFNTAQEKEELAVHDATFSWHQHGNEFLINQVTMNVTKGSLVGICGAIGSGKSSLLHALLGELHCNKGGMSLSARVRNAGVGFVGQKPWLMRGTIRENILFGSLYNAEWYNKVLHACALVDDILELRHGDQTEVGENGSMLSGGQRARVSLARVAYQKFPIYFLDDPFASVDSQVAELLFHRCIVKLLCTATRVVVSHQTQFFTHADSIILMVDGRVSQIGSPQVILGDVALIAPSSLSSLSATAVTQVAEEQKCTDEDDELTEKEWKEKGNIRLAVICSYFSAVGKALACVVVIMVTLMQATRNITDWWLAHWVSHANQFNNKTNSFSANLAEFLWLEPSANHSVNYYLEIYAVLAIVNSLVTFVRAFLFAFAGICAARQLHNTLFSIVLKAPMDFFARRPLGEVLNRFSSDVYAIDDSLPFIANIFMAQLFGLLGSIIVTSYALPWFVLCLMPLSLCYFFLQRFYRKSSRDIKRVASIMLSPIYSHFGESLMGAICVRAYKQEDRFVSLNVDKLDRSQQAQFCGLAISQWLAIRLQMLAVAMITGVAFIAVIEHHIHGIDPGLVGLALSYALSISSLLGGVLTAFAETEKELVSVERVCKYTSDIEPELDIFTSGACHPFDDDDGELIDPGSSDGNDYTSDVSLLDAVGSTLTFNDLEPLPAIEFSHVSVRYSSGLPLVVKDFVLSVESGSRVGILGRTGSGKSTLFNAMFRLVDIESGCLKILGQDIRAYAINDLRSLIAIIPQNPILFSGSLRFNLDPDDRHEDPVLKNILRICGLDHLLIDSSLPDLSAGQQQLVCLARALIKNAPIFCLDEATSSIDYDTAQHIEKVLQSVKKTQVIISHRVSAVQHCDLIVVMKHGVMVECGSPAQLLSDETSAYYAIVNSI